MPTGESKDVEDYMSDDYLRIQETSEKQKSRSFLRQLEIHKKKIETNESNSREGREIAEKTAREEKLNEKISSDNKGFEILKNMGYIPGTGLGPRQTGITDPLPLVLKSDRSGLGMRKKLSQNKTSLPILTEEDKDVYRQNTHNKYEMKRIFNEIRSFRLVCYDLDCKKSIDQSNKELWPSECIASDDDVTCKTSESEKQTHKIYEKKLSMTSEDAKELHECLINYLRDMHNYCPYCGIQYEDYHELEFHCPGKDADDH